MNKICILFLLVFLASCDQGSADLPTNETISETKQLISEIAQPSFKCSDYKDSLKDVNSEIQAVQNIREANEREKNAIDYHQKYKSAASQVFGGEALNGYVLELKVPGKIRGICLAEVFLTDGNSHNAIFTVSDVDGNDYLAMQDSSSLQTAILLYESFLASAKEKKEQTQQASAQQVQIPSETNVPQENIAVNNVSTSDLENSTKADVESKTKISPSFNCDKASIIIEKMICADSALAELDNKVALAYQDAMKNSANVENLKSAQITWLKTRNACQTIDCLTKSYESQHRELAPHEYEVEVNF